MEYATVEALREEALGLATASRRQSTLILSFLGEFFVEGNRGACPASEVAAALDDHLYALNTEIPAENGQEQFPKERAVLFGGLGGHRRRLLRRFYPPGDDEVRYEVTPAFEKAYAWVLTLKGRSFVGTGPGSHRGRLAARWCTERKLSPMSGWPIAAATR